MEFYHSYRGCDNEFDKLIFRMTTPRVVIDNAVCATATVVKVDSARKHGILLEAVQVLTDLNLSVQKAYISSDGRWFMDVFHVTDLNGNKLTDESVISYMEQSLGTIHYGTTADHKGLTALELTGTDRIGLLSEVFAVLSSLNCSIVDANVWTHNGRVGSLIYVKDCNSGSQIEDSETINKIESMLRPVLKGDNDIRGSATRFVSTAVTHTERRLHQMMFEDRDYERVTTAVAVVEEEEEEKRVQGLVGNVGLLGEQIDQQRQGTAVNVQNWIQRGYSVVNVQCKDRTKLLFDVVCTLTDMEYVVFHATVNTEGNRAYLEFYIRHKDGSPISSDAEMQRVIQCLEACIERRASQGVRLELCTGDRPCLLAEITRTFREFRLNVTRAEISTTGETAQNIFYVTDAEGFSPDPKTIDSVCAEIGCDKLRVKELPLIYHKRKEDIERENEQGSVGGTVLFNIGSLVRRNLYNLGLIKSYS